MVKRLEYFVKISIIIACLAELGFLWFNFWVSDFEFTDLVDAVLNLFGLLALVGIAWQRELFFPLFWKSVLALTLGWQIYFFNWSDYGASLNKGLIGGVYGDGGWNIIIVVLVVSVQCLKILALCVYSFPRFYFWQKLRAMLNNKIEN